MTLSGKLVIDAMNYWPPTDGRLPPPFDDEGIGTSEVVAERLHDATVVKTLNHVGYHELETLCPTLTARWIGARSVSLATIPTP